MKKIILAAMMTTTFSAQSEVNNPTFTKAHDSSTMLRGTFESQSLNLDQEVLSKIFALATDSRKFKIRRVKRNVMGYAPYTVHILTLLKSRDAEVTIEWANDLIPFYTLKVFQSGRFTDLQVQKRYHHRGNGFEIEFTGELGRRLHTALGQIFEERDSALRTISVNGLIRYPAGMVGQVRAGQADLTCMEFGRNNFRCGYAVVSGKKN